MNSPSIASIPASKTVPESLLSGTLNPIRSYNLTYNQYLSLLALRTSLTSAANNV